MSSGCNLLGNHPGPRENIAPSGRARYLLHPQARAVVGVGRAGAIHCFDAALAVIGVGIQPVVGHIAGSVVGEARHCGAPAAILSNSQMHTT